jgi:N-acetyl-anhydromuramyl-L-alanine amidase AmpD
MEIHQLLTSYNYSNGQADRIKYIVIHYVGALGGAEANCNYYVSQYVGVSAHYFVGFNGEIWLSVEDKNITLNCRAKKYTHPDCRNENSLGIELCVRNKGSLADTSRDWYFEDATAQGAIVLTRKLMVKYNIPAEQVIRHHNVTGKSASILLFTIKLSIPGTRLRRL